MLTQFAIALVYVGVGVVIKILHGGLKPTAPGAQPAPAGPANGVIPAGWYAMLHSQAAQAAEQQLYQAVLDAATQAHLGPISAALAAIKPEVDQVIGGAGTTPVAAAAAGS
jgi:hypothetical protein